MQQRFQAFLARHRSSDSAKAVAAAEELEIALYERYRALFQLRVLRCPQGRRRPPKGENAGSTCPSPPGRTVELADRQTSRAAAARPNDRCPAQTRTHSPGHQRVLLTGGFVAAPFGRT